MMKFKKISHKIFFFNSIPLFLFSIILIFSFINMNKTFSTIQNLHETENLHNDLLLNIEALFNYIKEFMILSERHNDESFRDNWNGYFLKAFKITNELKTRDLHKIYDLENLNQMIHQLYDISEELITKYNIQLANQNLTDGFYKLRELDFINLVQIQSEMHEISEHNINKTHVLVEDAKYKSEKSKIINITLLFFILIIFTVGSFYISSTISRPIVQIQVAAKRMSDGKLSCDIDIDTGDELESLGKSFNTMQKNISKRTNQLQKANHNVKQLLENNKQFMNQVAHDLRTPLTPILTLLPLIRKRMSNKFDKKKLNVVLNNANYLHEIVNDTLNISRLESGKIDFNYGIYDMKTVVDEIIDNNKDIFDKKKIKISNSITHDLPHVRIDKLRIKEVLENLVMNSMKFIYDHKREIHFYADVDEKHMTITVKDTGTGIRKEHLMAVFNEFYKVDSSRHEHSSGLGLTICKRIIKKHRGKIWAESEGLGKGTSIRFTVPIAKQ
ncbi:hypothetical protein COV93_00705 [Candidatus Woesearchaeota archaeon CG11_big_fil_rev_8_21_14_0_20_43_8]|nr:MAG: hypothetical protein COV93_00705 [Candidatus Woesearchaeota archaeon CG11_big_fil_rev_8_21_14_0_20_43_8]PIO06876.1 MAG: hypothetical protein COT47_02410 [Candidatus Woesearchaeota archaeon CG08_land_8_20_14_0_20_43_7]